MLVTWILRALKALTIAAFGAALAFGGATLVAAHTAQCDTPPGSCMSKEDCDPPACPNGGLCTAQEDCCNCFE